MSADTFTLRAAWQRDVRLAKKAVEEASLRCEEYAKAEAEYYAAKTIKAMQMKADGEPVTYIQTVIKGTEEVAPLLFAKTLAEGKYRAAVKAIDVYQSAMLQSYGEYKRSLIETGGNE